MILNNMLISPAIRITGNIRGFTTKIQEIQQIIKVIQKLFVQFVLKDAKVVKNIYMQSKARIVHS